jgi:hypothetical protein
VLRVYSAAGGARRLRLTIRNALGDQRLAFSRDGQVLLDAPVPVADISVPVPIDLVLDAPAGYHDIEIRPARQSQPDGVGRKLTFILDAVALEEAEASPVAAAPAVPSGLDDMAAAPLPAPIEAAIAAQAGRGRVLWDQSEGVGQIEGPSPEVGLNEPFRWVVARRCRLMLDTPEARHATLRIDYRCPVAGQRAILRVNEEPAQFLRLDTGALTQRFRLEVPIRLRRGRSAVELMLSETTREAAGERDLALLIEAVAIL